MFVLIRNVCKTSRSGKKYPKIDYCGPAAPLLTRSAAIGSKFSGITHHPFRFINSNKCMNE